MLWFAARGGHQASLAGVSFIHPMSGRVILVQSVGLTCSAAICSRPGRRRKGAVMKPSLPLFAAALLCLDASAANAAQSAQPAPAPAAGGASPDAECSAMATQQTGFDPARPPPPPATASPQVAGSGSRARGAAAGAMIGGASSGEAGPGAAAGAVAGGVTQRSRSRRDARQQNDATAQQQSSGQAAYNQAKTACLSAKAK
jgi:hypothetical protein